MPLSPDAFFQHAVAHLDADGRLPVPDVAGWETFPFAREGLQVLPLQPPALPEPSRGGADGSSCFACDSPIPALWSDDHWRLIAAGEPSGAPFLLMLLPLEHYDLPALSDERASELGRLLVHLAKAVESLPHIARAHISRWGDGGEHLHVFVYARPAGFPQLRGTCMAIWDDILPPVPADVRDEDAAAVAAALASSYGGTVHA